MKKPTHNLAKAIAQAEMAIKWPAGMLNPDKGILNQDASIWWWWDYSCFAWREAILIAN